MSAAPIDLVVMIGSVRSGRIGPSVADWFLGLAAKRAEFTTAVVDVMDLDLPHDLVPSPSTDVLANAISSADAVVVVTPEYNHGYPGSLKTALDSVKYEWRGKPIGFVSYGGLSGGARATEQLRQVAAELHMVSVRDSVAIAQVRKVFGDNRSAVEDAAVDAASRMLDQLWWWAAAAREMRGTDPYPGR